jgi:DnaJ-class molecular chaperone
MTTCSKCRGTGHGQGLNGTLNPNSKCTVCKGKGQIK